MHKMVMREDDGIVNDCFQTFHKLMEEKKGFLHQKKFSRKIINRCLLFWLNLMLRSVWFGIWIHGGLVIYIKRRLKQKIITKRSCIFLESDHQGFVRPFENFDIQTTSLNSCIHSKQWSQNADFTMSRTLITGW